MTHILQDPACLLHALQAAGNTLLCCMVHTSSHSQHVLCHLLPQHWGHPHQSYTLSAFMSGTVSARVAESALTHRQGGWPDTLCPGSLWLMA